MGLYIYIYIYLRVFSRFGVVGSVLVLYSKICPRFGVGLSSVWCWCYIQNSFSVHHHTPLVITWFVHIYFYYYTACTGAMKMNGHRQPRGRQQRARDFTDELTTQKVHKFEQSREPGARKPEGVVKLGMPLGSPVVGMGIRWNFPSDPCGFHWGSPGDSLGLPGGVFRGQAFC